MGHWFIVQGYNSKCWDRNHQNVLMTVFHLSSFCNSTLKNSDPDFLKNNLNEYWIELALKNQMHVIWCVIIYVHTSSNHFKTLHCCILTLVFTLASTSEQVLFLAQMAETFKRLRCKFCRVTRRQLYRIIARCADIDFVFTISVLRFG